jgi:alpha-L-fucosidase
MALRRVLLLSFLTTVHAQAVFNPKNVGTSYNGANPSFPVDLSSLHNNRAFAMKPGDANYDGSGSGYPANSLPPSNFIYNGINFTFPTYQTSGNDNALALGQTVKVPQGRYFSVQMMASSESGLASGFINATYSDNSTSSSPILVPAWWSWPYPAGGDIILPYYYTSGAISYNRSMFFQTINWLVSLTLPNVTRGSNSGPGGAAIKTRLHLFSLSMLPATGSAIDLEVQFARTTQLWLPNTNKTQIVEVIIDNVGSEWVLANNSVKVEVSSTGLKTVVPGYIHRLQPGDQAKVQVGVVNAEGVPTGTNGEATVVISGAGVKGSYKFNATFGITEYEATYESIYAHETPSWYDGAKYGIFIHWVSSIPNWFQGRSEVLVEMRLTS